MLRKIRKIPLSIITAWLLLMSMSITALAGGKAEWTAETENIYQDPITGDFVFTSVDKKKTTNTYYQTQGFTISDAVMVDGIPTATGLGEIRIALNDPRNDRVESEPDANGIITTTWTIPKELVYEKIAATSSEWMSKILDANGVHLKVDAIMAVHDLNAGYDPLLFGMSGRLDPETGLPEIGTTWDLSDPAQIEALLAKYPWIEPYINEHYLQALTILKEGGPDEIKPLDPQLQLNQEYVTTIGKDQPNYCTWNYNPEGKFELGDGIPTSENVRNAYESDRWFGTSQVCRRQNATHSWGFTGSLNWTQEYKWTLTDIKKDASGQAILDGNGQVQWEVVDSGVTYVPMSCNYAYTVSRQVGYWYLAYPNFYDFNSVTVLNDVYPDNGKHQYSDGETISMTCNISGASMTSTSSMGSYVPNDNWHVNWDKALTENRTLYLSVTGDSKSDAANKFASIAEASVLQSSEIEVRNDKLEIDGKSYMNDNYYQYKDIDSNSYRNIGSSDYGAKTGDSGSAGHNEKIPSNTANDKYPTTVTVYYKQRILATNATITKSKSGTSAIKSGYEKNEPIVVHTPTVSPVEICDPDTHTRLDPSGALAERLQTQLVGAAQNPNVDYQLLLDGRYTIKFLPEVHEEHFGYDSGDLVNSLYNKYCKFREVRFPFAVQIDGKVYEPDGTGYTEWIDLSLDQNTTPTLNSPDDFTVDFYIVPWAEENISTEFNADGTPKPPAPYIIEYRVAPENVVDQHGVNHIDDTEWLMNQTLNGNPLYEYVSTYTVNVQVSGIIYDFQAVGINDRDGFEGLKPDGSSWGSGLLAQSYPFCPTKQEKNSGTKNRIGGDSVRYTVDGTLTNDWPVENTLPFSVGRSQAFTGEGYLKKGHTFAFTIRTISNLWNETGDPNGEDYLIIKPKFRYYTEDGTLNENIDVYTTQYNADETELLYYVPYDSDIDKANKRKIKIADVRFDGSYYTNMGDYLADIRTIPNAYQQDDAEYSKDKANEMLYEIHKYVNPSYPQEGYKNKNNYLNRETENYCMSSIVMNSRLRLLTGNVEQLEMNLENEGASLKYIEDKNAADVSYEIKESTNPELWDKFHMSMQTWFGAYWVPNSVYVTDDTFEADTDGDGVNETYDSIWEYTQANGYIEGNEDFFKKDGYVVIQFEIYTVNDGVLHLQYYGGNKDQWDLEGAPDIVQGGDTATDELINIPVESGDVAVLDLERSVNDFFHVGYNRIN